MSRLGKNPVAIPEGVEVTVGEKKITTKGKLGTNVVDVMAGASVCVEDNKVVVTRLGTTKSSKMAWGAMRQLVKNAIEGVCNGFTRKLEVNGVGYRANVQGEILKLALGYSHDINFSIPKDVSITIEGDRKNIIAVTGIDKQRVGQVASNIRDFRRPEPYKGKGVKYLEEVILRKETKKK